MYFEEKLKLRKNRNKFIAAIIIKGLLCPLGIYESIVIDNTVFKQEAKIQINK